MLEMKMSKNKSSSNFQPLPQMQALGQDGVNCLWIAACCLGLAVFFGDGMASLPAKALVCVSTFFAAVAPWQSLTRNHRSTLRVFLFILLIATFALPITRIPGYYLQISSQSEFAIWQGLRSFAAVIGIACWFFSGRTAKVLFGLCCLLLLFAGYWTLRALPQPAIDVFFFFKFSASKLWEGENPYTLSMPNIYGSETSLYAPELIQGELLRFGFPYPLGGLVGPAVADFFLGDYRLGVLIAYVLAAACLGLQGTLNRRIALLALFFPRLEFIFSQGWSDAWSGTLLLAAAALSHTLGGGLCAGLWIASKQYLIPFAFSWICDLRRQKVASLICLSVATGLYLLPLCIEPEPYLWSVFGLQFIQPLRPDSLSFFFGPKYLMILAAAFWLMGFIFRCRTLLKTPSFSSPAAMEWMHWLLWGFFIFNKQAFANYFFTLYLVTLWVSGNYLNRHASR